MDEKALAEIEARAKDVGHCCDSRCDGDFDEARTDLAALVAEVRRLRGLGQDLLAWEEGVQDAKDWRQLLEGFRVALRGL